MISRFLWKIYWKLSGWSFKGTYPTNISKCVLVVAPHTSNWDVVIGMAARAVIPIKEAYFLGKKELFDGAFGGFFRWLGGVPVDRSGSHNMVDQVVDMFNQREYFALALSPEGTRKKVDRLKTGFYHIARQAGVPMILCGLDFSNKQLVFSEPIYAGNDMQADLNKIITFFADIKGKYPDQGLAHLLDKEMA